MTDGGDYANGIGYTANSDLSGMTLGNGVMQTYTWNDRLQPTGITASQGGTTLLGLGLYPCPYPATTCASGNGTGNTGSLLLQTITMPGLNLTQSYTYDHLNRLTQAQETGGSSNWSQSYGYDVLGNRWSRQTRVCRTCRWRRRWRRVGIRRLCRTGMRPGPTIMPAMCCRWDRW